ncbi:MAG: NAD+ synthase [Lentimicrobiaceae bacterium]|nr:NAD+ synthase [Lentimicrobiaceae bacterium]
MKIALAQPNVHIGNFSLNTDKIKVFIQQARQSGADLVVFPELVVSGYPPRDFLEFEDFIRRCTQAVEEIARSCHGIAAILGAPTLNPRIEGKNLHNSALLLEDGQVKEVRHKALLPNYDVFDEYRYFEPNRQFSPVVFKGKRIALTICEDLWDIGEDPLYTFWPMDELVPQGVDLAINIAASPFHAGQAEKRREVLQHHARKYGIPLFYANHVGAQTELIFDGGSMVIGPDGDVWHEMAYFREDLQVYDLDALMGENSSLHPPALPRIQRIHDALVLGIGDYFRKMGFSKAILGLSGGIDSAVTMVLAARALGPENVLGLLLPSAFSSPHSISDAATLAQNLGSPYHTISIRDGVDAVIDTLNPYFSNLPQGITEENIQARMRAVLLMAFSNKFGYILLNTSNKSEAAVGYGTLYGDMCGGLSVLGDVYKTEVYELARYINAGGEVIPLNSILKPPSAELRPDQKDSDSLPEYDILDPLLYAYIEERKGPRELVAAGFDKALVDRVLKLVNSNEYKRHQTPPILRISNKAFGMGRRMPIVGRYLS